MRCDEKMWRRWPDTRGCLCLSVTTLLIGSRQLDGKHLESTTEVKPLRHWLPVLHICPDVSKNYLTGWLGPDLSGQTGKQSTASKQPWVLSSGLVLCLAEPKHKGRTSVGVTCVSAITHLPQDPPLVSFDIPPLTCVSSASHLYLTRLYFHLCHTWRPVDLYVTYFPPVSNFCLIFVQGPPLASTNQKKSYFQCVISKFMCANR